MGNWYANISLRGPSQEMVVDALSEWGRTAFVSKSIRGAVVAYEASCRHMDGDDSERLAARLTKHLGGTAIIALNADDDELWLCVYGEGERVVEHLSTSPSRHNLKILCDAIGYPYRTNLLWLVFQAPFIFEVWRHLAICKMLDLPGELCTYGYPGEDDGTLSDFVPEGMFVGTKSVK